MSPLFLALLYPPPRAQQTTAKDPQKTLIDPQKTPEDHRSNPHLNHAPSREGRGSPGGGRDRLQPGASPSTRRRLPHHRSALDGAGDLRPSVADPSKRPPSAWRRWRPVPDLGDAHHPKPTNMHPRDRVQLRWGDRTSVHAEDRATRRPVAPIVHPTNLPSTGRPRPPNPGDPAHRHAAWGRAQLDWSCADRWSRSDAPTTMDCRAGGCGPER
jgi:hypothetical protein